MPAEEKKHLKLITDEQGVYWLKPEEWTMINQTKTILNSDLTALEKPELVILFAIAVQDSCPQKITIPDYTSQKLETTAVHEKNGISYYRVDLPRIDLIRNNPHLSM